MFFSSGRRHKKRAASVRRMHVSQGDGVAIRCHDLVGYLRLRSVYRRFVLCPSCKRLHHQRQVPGEVERPLVPPWIPPFATAVKLVLYLIPTGRGNPALLFSCRLTVSCSLPRRSFACPSYTLADRKTHNLNVLCPNGWRRWPCLDILAP